MSKFPNMHMLGEVTQEGHIIAYESRNLKIHEKNYATYDLELAAVIHALKVWCHHLIRRKFILMTNNKGLKYLLDQLNLNARQARWLAFLSDYDFEIQHIKGKEDKVANALSRNVKLNFVAALVIADFTTPRESHLYGLPRSLCRLLRPLGPFFLL